MAKHKINRNTKSATIAHMNKADERALRAYEEIQELHEQGASLEDMSDHLIDCGIKTASGKLYWSRTQVSRIIKRVIDRNLCP